MENFDPNLIPSFPPLAMPIPLWLSKVLIVVGFFLHAIPMKVVLGGTFIAAFFLWFNGKNTYKAGKTLVTGLPVILSFAITQGIVPLLFLQLIYGPLFYSSSIFMATFWISIIAILIVAYYILYIVKYQEDRLTGLGKNLLLISGILFLSIGFLFSNNMTLMINPENWKDMAEIATRGFNLNIADLSMHSRFLHFVAAAFEVTGLFLTVIGFFTNKDKEHSKWLVTNGSKIFVIFALIQALADFLYSKRLAASLTQNFIGGDLLSTIAFAAYVVLGLVAIILAVFAWKNGSKTIGLFAAIAGSLNVLALALVRHLIREFSVGSFFKPELIPTNIQWDIFAAFGILAIGLIIYLIWLVKLTWGALRK